MADLYNTMILFPQQPHRKTLAAIAKTLHSWSATLRKGTLLSACLWMRSVGQVLAYFVAALEVTRDQRQYPSFVVLAASQDPVQQ
jgi:hypothetical protein